MIALLWASPLGRMVSIGAVALLLGFGAGFLRGHSFANASYWQEQAEAAKRAAKDKELIAAADSARATKAETELSALEGQIEAMIRDTSKGSCKLSAVELDGLRKSASGRR